MDVLCCGQYDPSGELLELSYLQHGCRLCIEDHTTCERDPLMLLAMVVIF
jgi:hypothetical protein